MQSKNSPWLSHTRIIPLLAGVLGIFIFQGLLWARQNSVPDQYMDRSAVPVKETSVNAVTSNAVVNGISAGKGESSVQPVPVELNAENVEFDVETNDLVATGNVIVVRDQSTLTSDQLIYSRKTQMATATGNVVLNMGTQGSVTGDKFIFDFQTMRGKFEQATINSAPFYGRGEYIAKVGPNQMQMVNGFMTTCDHDKPHFRLTSRKIDIYPKDKIVARSMRMLAGNMPLMYIPRYTQRLDRKPILVMTPGYDKDWGAFLLTQWRYELNPHAKLTVYGDFRERKGVAEGLGLKYDVPGYGDGVLKTYYMNELTMQRRHFWEEKLGKTTDRERYRIAWRHRWRVNNRTNSILQYYKLSDGALLKDYFERERDRDLSPSTFALITHALDRGTLSFAVEPRINRFESKLEKLPELRMDLPTGKIGDTNFYWRNISTYSNLSLKEPSPTELRKETMRVHSLNEVSYPFKFSIFEVAPLVGEQTTYYSKTKELSRYNIVRNQFFTGASVSTKFFKLLDVQEKFLGIPVEKLRHIITPSVNYRYAHDPTVPTTTFDQFDEIDAITRSHGLIFTLENKLQTKRKGKAVDLLRSSVQSDFNLLKETEVVGSFNEIRADVEFNPVDWLTFSSDSLFSAHEDRLKETNFDLYINGGRSYANVGSRWLADADFQITTEFGYTINHKWQFIVYHRVDARTGLVKEENYTIRRDLHEWFVDLTFNHQRGEGDEILAVFTMKAFPEVAIDAGTSFNRRKAGSSSN